MSNIINSLIDALFGKTEKPMGPTMKYTIPHTPTPSDEDVAASRDYKNRYGNPNEVAVDGTRVIDSGDGNIKYTQQGTKVDTAPRKDVPHLDRTDQLFDANPKPASVDTADTIYKSQMMANTSPISALGFDINKGVFSPRDPNTPLTDGGAYDPKKDRFWADTEDPHSITHENTHRGMKLLRDKGHNIPKSAEENLVRAVMLNRFGDVESAAGSESARQVNVARKKMTDKEFFDLLTNLDDAANKELGQRTWDRHGGVN
jgi:hypothetical protein